MTELYVATEVTAVIELDGEHLLQNTVEIITVVEPDPVEITTVVEPDPDIVLVEEPTVTVVEVGIQGPRGPAGPAGGSAGTIIKAKHLTTVGGRVVRVDTYSDSAGLTLVGSALLTYSGNHVSIVEYLDEYGTLVKTRTITYNGDNVDTVVDTFPP